MGVFAEVFAILGVQNVVFLMVNLWWIDALTWCLRARFLGVGKFPLFRNLFLGVWAGGRTVCKDVAILGCLHTIWCTCALLESIYTDEVPLLWFQPGSSC